MFDCDVAVIGYGPTGMVLAALLGQCGHHVAVLERFPGLYNLPRAACFDDETMRTFQKLGLVEALADGVVAQDEYDWVNGEGETLVNLKYDAAAPGGWAALYMLYQPHLETVLDRHDKALGCVEVRQGFTVSALDQDEDGVTLTGSSSDGRRPCARASWSAPTAATASRAGPFARRWTTTASRRTGWSAALKSSGPFRPFPCSGRSATRPNPRRLSGSGLVTTGFPSCWNPAPRRSARRTRPRSGRASQDTSLRMMQSLSAPPATCSVRASRTSGATAASSWRATRPTRCRRSLGQGMCSGIRDGHNLAWKLDFVFTGRAGADILDTYKPSARRMSASSRRRRSSWAASRPCGTPTGPASATSGSLPVAAPSKSPTR